MLKTYENINAFCEYPFTRLKVTCEGNVTMCCFQERACLGNILTQSFDDIWFSERAERIRKVTLEGRLHKLCTTVSCPFNNKSGLVSKAIKYKRYPSQFEIDLPTQHCNIGGTHPTDKNPACLMCERHFSGSPETWWQEDKLPEVCVKLKPYVRYINAIHIQGVSEPFWKDRIFEIAGWLDLEAHKDRVRITSTTNGTLMTKERRARFLEYPNSNLVWSLDAGSPEVFVKLRRVDMYEKIIENLRAYSAERKYATQEVMIHNNINLINIDDVEKMVEVAASCNIDRLDFNATYAIPAICVNKKNVRQFRDAQKRIMEKARQMGVFVSFMRNLTLNYCNPVEWSEITPVVIPNQFVQIRVP